MTNVAEKRAAIVASRLPGVPPQYRRLYLRVTNGEGTRTDCMKAQCLECLDYDPDEIRRCTSYACALYAYRPFQPNPKRGKPRGRSIASGAK
jgi:hypothetical protein